MSQGDDIRAAADTMHGLREPLLTAVQSAARRMIQNGRSLPQAQAWVAAELLAVVADVLAEDLPGAPEQGLLAEDAPFDDHDTEQHLRIERDLAAAAARLINDRVTTTEATMQAATLALASIAGVLAGMSRQRDMADSDG